MSTAFLHENVTPKLGEWGILPSMERKPIHTADAPAAIGPYSQAIAAGNMLFCSGQIPLDPKTGKMVGEGDVAAQAEQCMQNMAAVLKEGGSSFGQIVKASIFLTDMGNFGAVNEVYAKYFEGMVPPARACVAVKQLPKDSLVEIEAIAIIG